MGSVAGQRIWYDLVSPYRALEGIRVRGRCLYLQRHRLIDMKPYLDTTTLFHNKKLLLSATRPDGGIEPYSRFLSTGGVLSRENHLL